MNDRLTALRLFVRVARAGSFSAAGRELGLSQPSVSRIISGLESDLGVQLLARTTRSINLTDAGRDYLARVESILDALEEADHAARGSTTLCGTLHVAVSSSFANRVLVPALTGFLAVHGGLRVNLRMSDSRQDLIREGVDVAMRFGPLEDSRATARLLGHTRRMVLAAPAYLKRHGVPAHPDALKRHALIVGPVGDGAAAWTFRKDDQTVSLRVGTRLRTSQNEAAIVAATQGMGIASSGGWGCLSELADGRLLRLLPDWRMGELDLHAVYPSGRATKPAARVLADYLADYLVREREREDALARHAVARAVAP